MRHYLADDLGPRAEGRDRFLLRVAASALAIAAGDGRGSGGTAAHAERLASLGFVGTGALVGDPGGRLDDERAELAALWATTLAKLAGQPTYRDESLEP
ncbi:MAG: hypothetical protein R2695_08970 [Acidimicrobiales bacterium]